MEVHLELADALAAEAHQRREVLTRQIREFNDDSAGQHEDKP
jgi:hypothetical protein